MAYLPIAKRKLSRSEEQQLVLYDHNDWKVILHDSVENKMVLFNSNDKSIVICEGVAEPFSQLSTSPSQSHQPSLCPYCSQNMPRKQRKSNSPPSSTSSSQDQSYMVKDYFNLLGYSMKQERKEEEPQKPTRLGAESMNSGYYRRFFVEEKKIGSGGFGSVYLCNHVINGVDLGKYAVKKIPVGDNRPWLLRVLREAKAMETLKKHPNIVNYQHSWLENDKTADFGPEVPCLFILMEYANGGSLADLMFGRKAHHFTEKEIWKFFLDMLQGLNYLHSMGIIHRDIKPQNMLITNHVNKEGVTETRLLISDFGTCQTNIREPTQKRTGNTGTVEYLAPELLKKDELGNPNENYDEKCDLWSLGVILFEMAFKNLPFKLSGNKAEFEGLIDEIINFQHAPFPSSHNRSQELVRMIKILLKANPRDRPTTDEILNSPFIENLIKQQKKTEYPYRTSGPGHIRSSTDSCIVVSNVEANLGDGEKVSQIVPGNIIRRRSISRDAHSLPQIQPPPDDHVTNSSTPLTSAGTMVTMTTNFSSLTERIIKQYSSTLFIFLLIIKLWLCLHSCTMNTTPSALYVYPIVLISIVQIMLAESRKYTRHQYILSTVQWLWGLLLNLTDSTCVGSFAPQDITFSSSFLYITSLFVVYLTHNL